MNVLFKAFRHLPAIHTLVTLFGLAETVGQAGDYACVTNNGLITITGYAGAGGNIVIPLSMGDLPVTSIGYGAFNYCSTITSVTTTNSLRTIEDLAFWNCANLTNVTISSTVTSIVHGPFAYCTSLKSITVDSSNPAYMSDDGVLFNRGKTVLVQYPGGKPGPFTLPATVTDVGSYALRGCSGLTGMTIPDSVTTMGICPFADSPNLTSVVIGVGLTKIGENAFANCTGLTNVTVSSGVKVLELQRFADCTNLVSLFCEGNAPQAYHHALFNDNRVVVYYRPGTLGWGILLDGHPTAVRYESKPAVLITSPVFGVQTNRFGFRVSWATNATVIIDGATSLASPNWAPLATNSLVGGWCDFVDLGWANYSSRLYRVRVP